MLPASHAEDTRHYTEDVEKKKREKQKEGYNSYLVGNMTYMGV